MATIVTFATARQAEVEIDVTNRRLRQSKPFIDVRNGRPEPYVWEGGKWVDYESTSGPIGIREVQFGGITRGGSKSGCGFVFWSLVEFVSIRTEPDPPIETHRDRTWDHFFRALRRLAESPTPEPEPEPELEDLVGPMRSDVIIRGAAELAASIFVQQGWADEWDPEEIEAELIATVGRARRLGRGQLSYGPFRRLHVTKGTSGKTYLSIDLDAISPEDFETEA